MQHRPNSRIIPLTLLLLTILAVSFTLTHNQAGSLHISKPATALLPGINGRILAFRELTLLPRVNAKQLERFAAEQLTPTFSKLVPGVQSYIIKGERGDNKEKYVHLLIFDSERTRDFYFPAEGKGEAGIPEAALKLWRPGQVMLLDSLPKYVKPLTSDKGYTDYVFLEK
jgi:hypothetical protein